MERHGRERESSPLSFLQALQKENKHEPMEDKALGCVSIGEQPVRRADPTWSARQEASIPSLPSEGQGRASFSQG